MNTDLQSSTCYKFDKTSKKWTQPSSTSHSPIPHNKDISITTYNILDGVTKPRPIYKYLRGDRTRFEHIFNNLIPSFDSDILTLNEITPTSMKYLLENDFIKNNYFVSSVEGINNIVLSKYHFDVFQINPRQILAVFETEKNKNFVVCSLHLRHLEEKKYALVRKKQLNDVTQIIKKIKNFGKEKKILEKIENAEKMNNLVILGDLNFHNLGETDFLYELGYEDIWLNVKGLDNLGFTWDPYKNTFISSWLKFDNRRMRLDRIAVKRNSNLNFSKIEIVGNKKKVRANFMCRKVHPSDHFGLKAQFKISSEITENGFDYYEKGREVILDGHSPWSTGYWKLKKIIKIRKIVCAMISSLVFCLILLVFTMSRI